MAVGASERVQIGPLTVRMRRLKDEFHYTARHEEANEDTAQKEGDTEDVVWNRWICGSGNVAYRLTPALPARSVVVRPVMPLQVLPGQSVDLFVSIPVWLRISLVFEGSETAVDLIEAPTVVLSKTWFGLPTEGELCYVLKTRARRRLEELRPDEHLAVCPLLITNSSDKTLGFDRLCVQPQFLGLYAGATHLWTNHGSLVYRGADTMMGLQFESQPPSIGGAAQWLCGPRETGRRSGVQRAYDSLMALSSFRGGV